MPENLLFYAIFNWNSSSNTDEGFKRFEEFESLKSLKSLRSLMFAGAESVLQSEHSEWESRYKKCP
jgi:hypothetical protein